MITIAVTKEIIDYIQESHPSMDIIATAIHKSVPGAHQMVVSIDRIAWTDAEGVRHNHKPPASAIEAMKAFDRGDPVQPFTFTLT